MTLGVLARIERDRYEIIAVESNSGAFVAGEIYSLGDSFCRQVIDQKSTIAETVIDNSPDALLHPLYRSLPLECYIGAPVMQDGIAWGTINFSSMAQREEPFNGREIRRIESMAQDVSAMLGEID